ncbi:MAG: hypothetical protein M3Q24_01345 [bacterium]|nr:hypothetical protein [bacterium]
MPHIVLWLEKNANSNDNITSEQLEKTTRLAQEIMNVVDYTKELVRKHRFNAVHIETVIQSWDRINLPQQKRENLITYYFTALKHYGYGAKKFQRSNLKPT